MTLRIYNTLSGEKEEFTPIQPGKVGIYCCGPTVYKNSHIGHMVGPVIFDTVKNFLTYSGYDVTLVINVTDVEDKLIREAEARGMTVPELAELVTADYLVNIAKLGVEGIDHMPKATDHIDGIIAITQSLIDCGHAYEASGDVYFDVSKDDDYGKLSHRDPEALQAGARIEPSPLKRNPGDFALWKAAKEGEPFWESPWGNGRPGWHIECSAMSMKILGQTFDIHGGGLDLVFPHHENEIAQSESSTGKPFANYWMHNGLLRRSGGGADKVGGRSDNQTEQEANKMGKSKGNTVDVGDLLERHDGETVRFFLLSTHYRRPIDFSDERIQEVGKGLAAFYRFFERFERVTGESFYSLDAPRNRKEYDVAQIDESLAEVGELRERFLQVMDDDFNTGGAVGILFDLLRVLNGFIDQHQLEGSSKGDSELTSLRHGTVALRELAAIIGVFRSKRDNTSPVQDSVTDDLLQLLVDLRQQARKEKNFSMADQIRDRLKDLSITLEDRPDGTGWRIE